MQKTKVIQRELPVKLTDAEIIKYAKELSKNNSDWAEVELQKKSASADFQARINRLKSEIEVVGLKVSTGVEYRSVDCTWNFNTPKKGLKSLIRTDTGQNVAQEKLTSEDVQNILALKKKDLKKEKE